jgi:hypothetical protein
VRKWLYLATVIIGVGIGVGLVYWEGKSRVAQKLYTSPVEAGEKQVDDGYNQGSVKYKLDKGDKIKAVIGGKVRYIGEVVNKDGSRTINLIIVDGKTPQTAVSYLLPAGAVLKTRQEEKVATGEVIAVAPENGQGLGCLGQANTQVTLSRGGQMLKVSEADFR